LFKLPTLTVTLRLPDPEELMLPSVTLIVAVCTSYSVITPLLLPETVATPLVKVIAVAVPKFTAVPELFVTVGWVTGLGEADAPEKVSDLLPV
jgi:hypothetical protein